MKINKNGFTLIEMMISTAIIGGTFLGIVRVTTMLSKMGTSNVEKQSMENNSLSILTQIGADLKKAGAGIQGSQDLNSGKTIIALPDNPMENKSPYIIFFSKDNAPFGTLGAEDYWTRFSVGQVDGFSVVKKDIFRSDNWNNIKAGNAPLVSTSFIRAEKGTSITALEFSLYDGLLNNSNQSPQMSSSVRIILTLKATQNRIIQEKTVNLDNIIYGPH